MKYFVEWFEPKPLPVRRPRAHFMTSVNASAVRTNVDV